MKCIKKDSKIQRVSDVKASKMILDGYSYCPKHEWKSLMKEEKKIELENKKIKDSELDKKQKEAVISPKKVKKNKKS